MPADDPRGGDAGLLWVVCSSDGTRGRKDPFTPTGHRPVLKGLDWWWPSSDREIRLKELDRKEPLDALEPLK